MTETGTSEPVVLIFAPFGKDAVLIEKVLLHSSVAILTLGTLPELASSIDEEAGAAVITEEVLQNGAIAALAQRLAQQPRWSDFPNHRADRKRTQHR